MNIRNLVNTMGIFSFILSRIGCLALFLMMGLTVVDVFKRHVFNSPILGSFEITRYLIVILIFAFIGHAQAQKAHVNVDIFVNAFPKKVQAVIDLFNYSVSLILMILVTWKGFETAMESMATGDSPMNLPVTEYPFVLFLALGCGIMCIELARDVLRVIFKRLREESSL